MHVPVTFLLKLIAEWISLLLQILADMSDIEEAFVITNWGIGCYKSGHLLLLQIGRYIKNRSSYYKSIRNNLPQTLPKFGITR